jgi:hypothetical protein
MPNLFKLKKNDSQLTMKWFPRSFYDECGHSGCLLYAIEIFLTVFSVGCFILWFNQLVPSIILTGFFIFWFFFTFLFFNHCFVRETIRIDQAGYHQSWGYWFLKKSREYSLERLVRFEVKCEKKIKQKKIYSLSVRVLHDGNSIAYICECARDGNVKIDDDFTQNIVCSESQDTLKSMMQELNDFHNFIIAKSNKQ